jgi:tetratricopeptide repeat protein 21B
MSKDFKPLAYYYARRNHNDLLVQLCETNLAKKGKDPIILFWKAYGLGKCGYIKDCFKQLDIFHNRKDLQLPVTLAMLYFHKNAPSVDQETIDSLTAELSIAEDVTVSNNIYVTNNT